MSWLRLIWLVLTTLAIWLPARSAAAVNLLEPFPSVLCPTGEDAPSNAKIIALGTEAPALEDLGFVIQQAGVDVAVDVEALGTDGFVFSPPSGFSAEPVTATVASGGGEASTTFLPSGLVDDVAPVITGLSIYDELPGELILTWSATDAGRICGAVAIDDDGVVLTASSTGSVLDVVLGDASCVQVSAFDEAFNLSAPSLICASPADAGAGSEPALGCRGASLPGTASIGVFAAVWLAAAVIRRPQKARRSAHT